LKPYCLVRSETSNAEGGGHPVNTFELKAHGVHRGVREGENALSGQLGGKKKNLVNHLLRRGESMGLGKILAQIRERKSQLEVDSFAAGKMINATHENRENKAGGVSSL